MAISTMINERVRIIRQRLDMTQEQLALRLGIGKAALSMIETGKAGLSARNKGTLVQVFNVSAEWLESGEGEMFSAQPISKRFLDDSLSAVPPQSVPLYRVEGSTSVSTLLNTPNAITPQSFVFIPNLPICDGAIHVNGDSMHPILRSGDIVLYKHITDFENIFWGEIYLIVIGVDGDEYVTVRHLHKADSADRVRLVSQNDGYADKEIEIGKIKALAMVKASIRLNSIK